MVCQWVMRVMPVVSVLQSLLVRLLLQASGRFEWRWEHRSKFQLRFDGLFRQGSAGYVSER